jgi:hypothetical protein
LIISIESTAIQVNIANLYRLRQRLLHVLPQFTRDESLAHKLNQDKYWSRMSECVGKVPVHSITYIADDLHPTHHRTWVRSRPTRVRRIYSDYHRGFALSHNAAAVGKVVCQDGKSADSAVVHIVARKPQTKCNTTMPT